jgi:predicted anti-sigma-YlaC factor YlaD
MSDQQMTCAELVVVITDYLEGVMSDGDRARFDEHIAVCPGCTIYLEQMRTTIRLAGILKEEDVTPEARDALVGALRGRWPASG